MNVPTFFFPFLVTAFSASPTCAQFSSTAPSAESAVVSVQQLSMPRKAAHAFEKGSKLLVSGDPQSSLPYLQNAAELAPNNYAPYHNLAIAEYELGHMDEAGEYFQKAIDASKSSYAPSLFGLSMILYRRGDYAQSEALIRQGLLLAPNSAAGKYCLGLVQYSAGRTADAQRSALDAIRLNPDGTVAKARSGLWDAGMYPEEGRSAIAAASRAISEMRLGREVLAACSMACRSFSSARTSIWRMRSRDTA